MAMSGAVGGVGGVGGAEWAEEAEWTELATGLPQESIWAIEVMGRSGRLETQWDWD
jgi:hypothetical protein